MILYNSIDENICGAILTKAPIAEVLSADKLRSLLAIKVGDKHPGIVEINPQAAVGLFIVHKVHDIPFQHCRLLEMIITFCC